MPERLEEFLNDLTEDEAKNLHNYVIFRQEQNPDWSIGKVMFQFLYSKFENALIE